MFKITIASTPQRILDQDLNRSIAYFLSDIGYIPRLNPNTDFESISKSVYFRLFKECFLDNADRYWTGEELMAFLKTSRTTLYRHLNKLKSMDLLEEEHDGKNKKYRLRGGNLETAWNWVKININMALDNYEKTVEHVWRLSKKQ